MKLKSVFRRATYLVCFGSVATLASAAVITPVSQSRSTYAYVGWGSPPSASQSAPGFAVFDSTLSLFAYDNAQVGHSAYATQHSEIDDSSIVANGSASITRGSANSQFSVTFTLAQPYPFSLNGSVNGLGGFPAGVVTLSGPSGSVYSTPSGYSSYGFSQTGTLNAGQYVISAIANPSVSPSDFQAWSLNLQLTTVPEPSTVALVGSALLPLLLFLRIRRA